MHHWWKILSFVPIKCGFIFCQDNPQPSMSLLAIAVGIKQKAIVNQIVKKVTFNLDILLASKIFCAHLCNNYLSPAVPFKWFCCDAFSLWWCCGWMEGFIMERQCHPCVCSKSNKMVSLLHPKLLFTLNHKWNRSRAHRLTHICLHAYHDWIFASMH